MSIYYDEDECHRCSGVIDELMNESERAADTQKRTDDYVEFLEAENEMLHAKLNKLREQLSLYTAHFSVGRDSMNYEDRDFLNNYSIRGAELND